MTMGDTHDTNWEAKCGALLTFARVLLVLR